MIKLLPNLPDNTIGLTGSGRVTASDYEEVLIPAVEAALKNHKKHKKHNKLRPICELGSDFTGCAPGAIWDDMKLGVAHRSAWERIAVVTDVSWIANGANMFKFVMPCTVKVFSLKDRDAAEKWIAA